MIIGRKKGRIEKIVNFELANTNFRIYLHIIAAKTKYGIITAGKDALSIDFAPQKRIKKAANHEMNKVIAKKIMLQDLQKNNQYYNKAEFAVV